MFLVNFGYLNISWSKLGEELEGFYLKFVESI